LSEKENIREVNPAIEQNEEDLDSLLLDFDETYGEGTPSPEKLADMARKAPDPVVNGNAQIEFLSHSLIPKRGKDETAGKGVAFGIKNTAGSSIGNVVFEAVLFDAKGNIIDTLEQSVVDLEAGKTRNMRMETRRAATIDVKSYDVRIKNMVVTPVPVVTGDERISILRHDFQDTGTLDVGITQIKRGIELAVRNVSGEDLATVIFEAELFDSGGGLVQTLRHKEHDIKSNTSRAFLIQSNGVKEDVVRSYNIKVIKTVTSDVEKVQLRRNEVKRLRGGREELSGLLKTISRGKTSAVLVVTYLDADEEPIGLGALRVNDIEPGTVRNFSLGFTAPEGETVKTRNMDIGEMIEADIADEA